MQTLNYSEWMARSIKNSIDGVAAKLQKGLTFLGSTGATAPFIGLFGTVWGIYHALIAISTSGSAQIDQVAGPIGEALIMTALGLAVAIPAVLGFNAINRANKLLVTYLMMPLAATTLALLVFNWYPAKVCSCSCLDVIHSAVFAPLPSPLLLLRMVAAPLLLLHHHE